jgi:glycosyltransferase 2 family protein
MSNPVRIARSLVPWIITAAALWFAFRGIDWASFFAHLFQASPLGLLLAVGLTACSYLFRGRRWQFLFPTWCISFVDSTRVLLFGFFMNNILPARTGEFVRAHFGSKVTGQRRTLVLATVFSERLLDGLTLSLMFVAGAAFLSSNELRPDFRDKLNLVAAAFLVISFCVLLTIVFRRYIFALAQRVAEQSGSRARRYALSRVELFVRGLEPLATLRLLPAIVLWSVVVWGIELSVFAVVAEAYSADLTIPECVLFLVAVSFSSLIPAAPGGLGVIEAIATTVLASIGIDREKALAMVLTQHVIQYVVVGIPGGLLMFRWSKQIPQDQGNVDEVLDEPLVDETADPRRAVR